MRNTLNVNIVQRYVPLIYAFQIPEDIDQSPFSVQRVNLMAILTQITILTRYVSLFPSSSKTSGLSVFTGQKLTKLLNTYL